MKRIAIPTILAALALGGCHGHDDHSPAEDACSHMTDNVAAMITAVDDLGAAAPAVSMGHTRYEITLVGDGADLGGYVDWTIGEAGEYHVFLSDAVPLALWDGQGDAVAASATNTNVTECAEVSVGYSYDLGVGTYTMQFGPTALDVVSLVLVDEDDHDH
jgi:hypothetical protein